MQNFFHLVSTMKFHGIGFPNRKHVSPESPRKAFLLSFSLVPLIIFLLCIARDSGSSPSRMNMSIELEKRCDIFSGQWVFFPKGPHYTDETCSLIIDQQNCLKFGRPDREFLKWRWKPDECELPLFDPTLFLELVRGESMAFVGDSVGRNQMQSLLCLLAGVANPEDISLRYSSDTNFRCWFFKDYNFTLATFWSPFLVKARDADSNGHNYNSLMNLYLDEVDENWANEINEFNYVIISAGNWFFRPLVLYEKGQVIGCSNCQEKNITDLSHYYGYKKAFQTSFRTLLSLKQYKGVTLLRTFSPPHFENGEWNKGGNCVRKRPFKKDEIKLDGYILKMYLTQLEEFREAVKEATRKGLKFLLLNTTEMMLLRPDGHPNNYGRSLHNNNSMFKDCVHWCLPGPIDTWNEFLLHILKRNTQRSHIFQ